MDVQEKESNNEIRGKKCVYWCVRLLRSTMLRSVHCLRSPNAVQLFGDHRSRGRLAFPCAVLPPSRPGFSSVLDGGTLPVVSNDPIVLSCVPCEAPPLPALDFLRGSSGDIIQFEDANGTGYVYFFRVNSLLSLGTHNTQPGMNVHRVPSLSRRHPKLPQSGHFY